VKELTCGVASLGMVAQPVIPAIQEAEAGRLKVQGQPGLHGETLSQNNHGGVSYTSLRRWDCSLGSREPL
jgi:hypothetical protein